MQICFTSDLHGSDALSEALEHLLRESEPALLILGGDLCRDADRTRPILPQLAAFEESLLGWIRRWQRAVPRLTVAAILGNHDLAPFQAQLARRHAAGDLVQLDLDEAWEWGGHRWLGCPLAPPSPHWAKDFERRDLPDDPPTAFDGVAWDDERRELVPVETATYFSERPSLRERLRDVAPPTSPWVLVAHAPPYGSNLDRLPHIDRPIGSRAVREFIERTQPAVSLHGHIHDAPDVSGSCWDRIGRTLCINPGQARDGLRAVLLDLSDPIGTLDYRVGS